jgi:amidase
VPTGVQIAGQTYDDLTPFRIDAALEEARPPLETPGAEATPPRLLTGA